MALLWNNGESIGIPARVIYYPHIHVITDQLPSRWGKGPALVTKYVLVSGLAIYTSAMETAPEATMD